MMLMQKKYFLVGYKTLFGLLALLALVTEIAVGAERNQLIPTNFFSYFTVEANTFAAIMFIISAIAIARGRRSIELTMLRGAAALYMITTGIVFGMLLSGYDSAQLTFVPWDNVVLHYIIPFVALLDWLCDPPERRLQLKNTLVWLLYPIVYLAYSLIRGPIVEWYPYPFLNPAQQHGYVGVAVTAVVIAITVIIISWALTLAARPGKKAKRV
jgi:hypothetical protein